MNCFRYTNVNEMYRDITRRLLSETSENGTRELRNVMLTIENTDEQVITERDTSLSYLCGELLWYMTGSNDVKFISKFSNFWSRITDDGNTSNSAYGDIVLKRHGFNQLEKIIELLEKDKNSRRAVINFNVPNENVISTKDEICTIMLQFLIRNDRLHCTAVMRSNDVYTGMPYDIAFFIALQKIIAHKLKLKCGEYTHFVVSLHLYDRSEEKLRLSLDTKRPKIKLNSINLLKLNRDDYELIDKSESPKTDIIGLFIHKDIIKVEE